MNELKVNADKEKTERVGLYVSPETRRDLNVLAAILDTTQDKAIRFLLSVYQRQQTEACQ